MTNAYNAIDSKGGKLSVNQMGLFLENNIATNPTIVVGDDEKGE